MEVFENSDIKLELNIRSHVILNLCLTMFNRLPFLSACITSNDTRWKLSEYSGIFHLFCLQIDTLYISYCDKNLPLLYLERFPAQTSRCPPVVVCLKFLQILTLQKYI